MKSKMIVPWKKAKGNLGQTALSAVVRGAGGVAGAFIQNKLGPKLPASLQKHKGIAAFLIGTAGDVFIEQPQIKAAFQGIAVSGIMQEAIEFAGTDLKPAISLQGIDSVDSINANDPVDYDRLAEEAEREVRNEPMKGLNEEEEALINGLNSDDDDPAALLS